MFKPSSNKNLLFISCFSNSAEKKEQKIKKKIKKIKKKIEKRKKK
jgi:NTP pyrophosphatase (non-canonical NTP hydrolase)